MITEPGTYHMINGGTTNLYFHFRKNEVIGMRGNVPEFSFSEKRMFRSVTIIGNTKIVGLSWCGFYVLLIADAAGGRGGINNIAWKLDAEYQSLTQCLGTESTVCVLRGAELKPVMLKGLDNNTVNM